MECPSCHKEHSSIAVYCPHCGETLPAPPGEEAAAGEGKLGITADLAPPPQVGGQRTAMKILVPIVTMLVVASVVVTHVTRRHVSNISKTVDTDISTPLQTLPSPVVTSPEEDAVYNAALQYALTQGKLGLGKDGVSVIGSVADVRLKDPASGKRYRVSLVKGSGENDWVAMSMEEVD